MFPNPTAEPAAAAINPSLDFHWVLEVRSLLSSMIEKTNQLNQLVLYNMQITQCIHTAILVSDLTKAEKFYRDILGLSPAEERPLKYPGIWYRVGNYQIHLIVHPQFTSPILNPEKWGRNPHLALAVDNLEEAKQRLQSNGYTIQMSASGRGALFTRDPDGNVIEISQEVRNQ